MCRFISEIVNFMTLLEKMMLVMCELLINNQLLNLNLIYITWCILTMSLL